MMCWNLIPLMPSGPHLTPGLIGQTVLKIV
jgi:hypothetical protein